jgi:hypothetical protein
MPSLLDKLLNPATVTGRKPNPYTNPHHPNHPNTSQPAPTSTTARQVFSTSPRQAFRPEIPPPASPHDPYDYLAEAREASGRDAVTGQPRNQNREHTRSEREEQREERSVYQESSSSRSKTHGTKYDLFVQEMKARKGGRWRAPDVGFYAPERRLGEFYQPERSGGQGHSWSSGSR